MAKTAAFGTLLKLGDGALQVETATFVGTITGAGNATVTITAAGMTGSPLAVTVPVALNDTPTMVAAKAFNVINLLSAVTALFYVSATGPYLVLTRRAAVANDATLNIAFTNGTCTGLTPNATSANTIAGGGAETFTAIANVSNISGPGLALDTVDVTSHDSTNAWEEVAPTVLRSGEITLDIVYDPGNATHAAGVGVLSTLENKIIRNLQLVFPGPYTWSLAGYVTAFESSAAFDGALTASVTLKITGAPTLA
jgi:predicted secreted protein